MNKPYTIFATTTTTTTTNLELHSILWHNIVIYFHEHNDNAINSINDTLIEREQMLHVRHTLCYISVAHVNLPHALAKS